MVSASHLTNELYALIFHARNESFTFHAAPATQPKMHAWIYDHKTLGKDKLLGSAEIDVRGPHLRVGAPR